MALGVAEQPNTVLVRLALFGNVANAATVAAAPAERFISHVNTLSLSRGDIRHCVRLNVGINLGFGAEIQAVDKREKESKDKKTFHVISSAILV